MNKRILWMATALVLILTNVTNVSATTISDAKKQKKEAEEKLNDINEDIESIEDMKESLEEEAEEYQQQLVDLLVTIQVINGDINFKEEEINIAQSEYDEAVEKMEAQKKAMNKRIKYMYEKGDLSYMQILLESRDFTGAVNKSTYAEKLYSYDRYQLYLYQQTKEDVADKKIALEEDLSELEEIKADATEQEVKLENMIDEYSETIENFEEELSSAKEKADEYKAQIQKQTESIKSMEAEEKRKAAEAARIKAEAEAKKKAEEAAKKKQEEEALKKAKQEEEAKKAAEEAAKKQPTESTPTQEIEVKQEEVKEPEPQPEETPQETYEEPEEESHSEPTSSGGSALGNEIAAFACQFVGNPYVPGGTSLTEGADCSGFTLAVYNHFGISLPRSSGSQAGYGRGVSYAEAVPGDIIYYGGHVGIYIGNGQIVHASTQATGIKISNALYRSIISVRRIVE